MHDEPKLRATLKLPRFFPHSPIFSNEDYLLGFRTIRKQELLFSDFFLLFLFKTESTTQIGASTPRRVGLKVADSDSLALSNLVTRLISPAEFAASPAVTENQIRILANTPLIIACLFSGRNPYTADQIRARGKMMSRDTEFHDIGNSIWLMCELMADLLERKINSTKEWREAGLKHTQNIANSSNFKKVDRLMINFLEEHKEYFLRHGMVETVLKFKEDFPAEILALAQEALACKTSEILGRVAFRHQVAEGKKGMRR